MADLSVNDKDALSTVASRMVARVLGAKLTQTEKERSGQSSGMQEVLCVLAVHVWSYPRQPQYKTTKLECGFGYWIRHVAGVVPRVTFGRHVPLIESY